MKTLTLYSLVAEIYKSRVQFVQKSDPIYNTENSCRQDLTFEKMQTFILNVLKGSKPLRLPSNTQKDDKTFMRICDFALKSCRIA